MNHTPYNNLPFCEQTQYVMLIKFQSNPEQVTQVAYLPVSITSFFLHKHTMWYHYKMINFLQNPHKRHPKAHPLGLGMGCLLWFHNLIYILPQAVQ